MSGENERKEFCSHCDYYTDHVSTAHHGLQWRGLLLPPPTAAPAQPVPGDPS